MVFVITGPDCMCQCGVWRCAKKHKDNECANTVDKRRKNIMIDYGEGVKNQEGLGGKGKWARINGGREVVMCELRP